MIIAKRKRLVDEFVDAARSLHHQFSSRGPSQGPVEQLINAVLFVGHTRNLPTLRGLHRIFGARMRVFGGETYARFIDARELMGRELEKIDWFSGPVQDRADYLTKSYVPFLLAGPNHDLRRQHMTGRITAAHRKLDDLEALLDRETDAERALVRFLFRHLCRVELDDQEVGWLLEYRAIAQPMILLPKVVRVTLLRGLHERLQKRRAHFLEKIQAAGEPIGDSWFDAIWFNAATLGFYPEKALAELDRSPALAGEIREEVALPPGQRPKTRALIHEMLRIHGRIASTNYVDVGTVRVALLATAVVDPDRYTRPLEVDLSRDHSDTLAFAGASPTRRCPADLFAPDVMATVVAHRLRHTGDADESKRRKRNGV